MFPNPEGFRFCKIKLSQKKLCLSVCLFVCRFYEGKNISGLVNTRASCINEQNNSPKKIIKIHIIYSFFKLFFYLKTFKPKFCYSLKTLKKLAEISSWGKRLNTPANMESTAVMSHSPCSKMASPEFRIFTQE